MNMFMPSIVSDAWKVVDDTVTAVVKFAKNLVSYEIVVYTGDKRGAGTDSNVFITLYGTNGDSGKRPLKGSKLKNLFERAQKDSFEIEVKNLGQLEKVIIETDGKGIGAGWYLEKIDVRNMSTGNRLTFQCNEWLDPKKGDCQTSRELYPDL